MSQWEGVMQKHAKTFYLASLFFPRQLLPKVKALYALCRWLDDAADEAPNEQAARLALDNISNDLHAQHSKLPVNVMYKENQLNVGYIDDLIEGAKDDLEIVRVQTVDELVQYSYKVAGTVGLAMFELMAAQPESARANAVDLGIAMQITNICRDVKEDLQRNRIYIPIELLNKYQISEQDFIDGFYKEDQLVCVIREMLTIADSYYASAALAFGAIPFRTRGAIIIASSLYRGIGVKLLRTGGNPMRGRCYLTGGEKLMLVAQCLGQWLISPLKKYKNFHNNSLHGALGYWRQLRGFEG